MDKKDKRPHIVDGVKWVPVSDDEYKHCWETGDYFDQDCEQCEHAYECSGYTGDTYDED